ncbi:hypothetical protein CHLRE_11g475576v5 [Chlamydomonas reinhardtii]|uniref:Uncharacterized protein n=1 Tax=Chlamydomonas reinhardtii TaxID=3055 RepID=A0A2K3D8C2_CHLRE|nr:uncharacterized protein CHLRE_11g475576v5 [Chlamydomonas reinhardtii]PNW76772.1 hypothetical protein CHLRE_11g475576v5 [Chlamydomonas reinhardtii]
MPVAACRCVNLSQEAHCPLLQCLPGLRTVMATPIAQLHPSICCGGLRVCEAVKK